MITNKKSARISLGIINIVFILFALLCIVPLIVIISISLSRESDILQHGYKFLPLNVDFTAYKAIFKTPEKILNSYMISLIVTILGGGLGLLVTAFVAYPLSRKDYRHRNKLSFYFFFIMLFNGGLVPSYILISNYLHMKDKIWVLILPYLVNVWYIFLMRSYFSEIPVSLLESARIDGAGEIRTFVKIVLPLSKPALATVGLFLVLQYWNDWWLSLLYINNEKMVTLQYFLYRMMNVVEYMNRIASEVGAVAVSQNAGDLPAETIRMAMCIVAAGPMLFVFPFFQKYFVKGLTLGAVKG